MSVEEQAKVQKLLCSCALCEAMHKKLLFLQAGVFVLFVVVALILGQNIDAASELRQAVLSLGALGWLGFLALYTAGTVLLFPGTIFTVFGALLYGLWFGFALNLIGALLGAVAAYYAARLMGRRAFDGLAPQKLKELEVRVAKRPFETVLMLRLIPLIPYNALSFALGVTSIRIKPYVFGTLLGIAPTRFAYTYATVRVGEVVAEKGLFSLTGNDLVPLIPVFVLVVVLALIPFAVRRFYHNKA